MKFNKKINYKSASTTPIREVKTVSNGIYEGVLQHDNIVEDSLIIKDSNGYTIESFSINEVKDKPWSKRIVVQTTSEYITIEYLTKGDTVDADDINELQDAILKLKSEIDNIDVPDVDLSELERDIRDLKVNKADRHKVIELYNNMVRDLSELQDIVTIHSEDKSNPHRVTKSQVGLGNVDNTSDMDKPISREMQIALDEITHTLESLDVFFHDVPQNTIKEDMPPRDFEYGATICSQNLVNDFPSINEYGVSYTLIGRHSNYAQIFITRFGDIWSRRSTTRSEWNGEWYNAKNEIEKLELELEDLKATGGSQEDINKLEESIKELESKMPDTLDDLYVSESWKVPAGQVVHALQNFKADKTDIGNLSNLQTENKDNLVSAINEIDESKLNKDGDTATGIIKAHNNTKYGVGQIRNIIISKNTPNISQMKNGDIWLKYD